MLARTHKEWRYEAWSLRLLDEITAHGEPLDAKPAMAFCQQAIALAEALEMSPLLAHCHFGLGTLYPFYLKMSHSLQGRPHRAPSK